MNISRKKDRIVILTDIVQTKLYIAKHARRSDIIFCLGPAVKIFCEDLDLKHIQRQDIINQIDFERARNNQYDVLNKVAVELNEFSAELAPFEKLEIGTYFYFQLWVVFGIILNAIMIVESVLKNYPNRDFLIFSDGNKKMFLKYRPNANSTFIEVVQSFLNKTQTHVEIVKYRQQNDFSFDKHSLIQSLPNYIQDWMKYLRDKKNFFGKKTASQNKLLLVGGIYDWKEIYQHSEFTESFSISFLPPRLRPKNHQHKAKICEILEQNFVKNGKCVFDFDKLALQMSSDLSFYQKDYKRLSNSLSKFAACVSSVLTFPEDHFVAHAFDKLNKPVIIWQHGEKGQTIDPTVPFTELSYASDYLSFAPKVTDIYNKMKKNNKLRNVSTVGSLHKNIQWNAENNIVYATGKWQLNSSPITALDADARLLEAQSKLFKYFDQANNKNKFIFKVNNTKNHNHVVVHSEQVKVEFDASFVSLLKVASCVILDTPATTMVEAATTDVPIFVLGGRSEYTKDFLEVVKKRVVWREEIDDLITEIDSFIIHGNYSADINNLEYRNLYCPTETNKKVISNVKDALKLAIVRSN